MRRIVKKTKIGDVAKVQIDENLKRIFEEDAEQDLPDELMSLLDKLDDVEVPASFARTRTDSESDA